MTAQTHLLQRITALTPLAEILSRIDAIASPSAVHSLAPMRAAGGTLAADVVASADTPAQPTALIDGWAVNADEVIDASSYAPAVPRTRPVWLNAGEPLPAGTDAVLPSDVVNPENLAEVHAPAASGDGVLLAGMNAGKDSVLRPAGARVRMLDAAVFEALGVDSVPVRTPAVKIITLTRVEHDYAGPVIADAVRAHGGAAAVAHDLSLEAAAFEAGTDAVIGIGGTGTGRNDNAVISLARLGSVECHGFAVAPGQTAALGHAKGRPILLLPGRLDAALAVFLLVGRHLMNRLSGARGEEKGLPVTLVRKVSSTIGLSEVVFVRRVADGVEPLGQSALSLQALAQADGWIHAPAESEGMAAGTMAEMRTLP